MSTPASEQHLKTQRDEQQRRYDALTKRIAALDTDIARNLDSEGGLVLKERRAELARERDRVAREMELIDQQSALLLSRKGKRFIFTIAVVLAIVLLVVVLIWTSRSSWLHTTVETRAAATAVVATGPGPSLAQTALEPTTPATEPTAAPTVELTAAPAQSLTPSPPNTAVAVPTAHVEATSPLPLIAKSAGLFDETGAYQFAWSPDGRFVAIGGSYLHLYDVAAQTGRLVSSDTMGRVIFSSDGSTVFAAPYDDVTLWDAATWTKLNTIPGSKGVETMAVSPDGTTLVAAIGEAITFWDLASGTDPRTFPAGGHIQAMAFSPDGRTVASGGSELALWDVVTGVKSRTYQGQTNVTDLAFSPDGKLLAVSSDDGTRLWDLAAGRPLHLYAGHTGRVNSVAFSPSGQIIATGGNDLTVRLWDAATGKQLQSITGHTGGVSRVAFSPDGAFLASGAADGLRLWQLSMDGREVTPTLIRATPPATRTAVLLAAAAIASDTVGAVAQGGEFSETGAYQFAWSPDGSTVAIGGSYFYLYDVAAGTGYRAKSDTMGPIRFTPDGDTLFAASGGITMWDVATVTELSTLSDSKYAQTFAISPDGATLIAVTGDALKLWDIPSGVVLATVPAGNRIQALAFSPDGRTLATGGSKLSLWDVATGVKSRTFEGQANVTDLAFSPDGKVLAVSSDDGTRLWDLAAGRPLHLFAGHTGRVSSVAFSPGGLIIATGGDDQTVRLWDVATGEELASLTGHTAAVSRVAFSPDGAILASGGSDGLRLWSVAP